MLDSFEKESRLQERRAARQRQMQIMEEAASGVGSYDDKGSPRYTDDPMGGAVGSGLEMESGYKDEPTMGGYVDEDSEDDVPSMYSDYSGRKSGPKGSLKAASNLWGSGTKNDLSEDKLKFVMGEDDNSSQYSASSWRRKEHVESQELLMMAERRVNGLEIGYGDTGERRKYNRCGGSFVRYKRLIYSLGALLAVVLIVMGVAIGEKNKNTNHDGAEWPPKQQGSSSTSGTSSNYNPEQSASNPASPQEIALNPNKELDQAKFNRIRDRILEHQISHASTLEDTNSPQYKALTWLVRDDPRQLDVASIDDEASGITGQQLDKEEALFERYALVVFWFATTDLNVVNSQHDNRRRLQDGVSSTEYTQSDIQWKQSTDWLTSSGFCQWHGIVCHPDVTSSNPNSHYNDDFHVAILNLTDNNIHGEIPREVFVGLSKIQALDLSANGLGGEIGREVGELKDLQGKLYVIHQL